MLVLVRVILQDRPGALARATSAIAEIGGNILGMDVVDSDDATVVDDFVIDIGDAAPAALVDRLDALPGTAVDCVRSTPETELHRELELITTLASDPRPSLDLLARLVPAMVRCDWAVVLSAVGPAVGVSHASADGPRLRWSELPWLPLKKPTILDPNDDWVPTSWHSESLSLAAAPVSALTCVLACRLEGPAFRPREVDARLAQLGRLAGRLLDDRSRDQGSS